MIHGLAVIEAADILEGRKCHVKNYFSVFFVSQHGDGRGAGHLMSN